MSSYLGEPDETPAVTALFEEDLAEDGYVMNATRLWARNPQLVDDLFTLMSDAFRPSRLEVRQRGIVVLAMASTLGDSYCSLAWGGKVAGWTDAELARAVLTGTDEGLTEQERAIATWVRQMVTDPNATKPEDVGALRQVGLDDDQIFAITTFAALRLAFSTVNDALGATPDRALVETLPPPVVEAVTWGRPPRSGDQLEEGSGR